MLSRAAISSIALVTCPQPLSHLLCYTDEHLDLPSSWGGPPSLTKINNLLSPDVPSQPRFPT